MSKQLTVKRLVRKRGHFEAHPTGPDVQPIVVKAPNTFTVEAVMVGFIRKTD